MKCQYCKLEILSKFFKSCVYSNKYFTQCVHCSNHTLYKFPDYLPKDQFDKYLEEATKKGKIG